MLAQFSFNYPVTCRQGVTSVKWAGFPLNRLLFSDLLLDPAHCVTPRRTPGLRPLRILRPHRSLIGEVPWVFHRLPDICHVRVVHNSARDYMEGPNL